MQVLANSPKDFKNVLSHIKTDTRSIEIANINCLIDCKSEAFFCDTIAIGQDNTPAKTLELPLQYLSSIDAKSLVEVFLDTYTFRGVHHNKKTGVTDIAGHCNCMYDPTVALLFKNSDSVIFAQIMLDVSYGYCVVYYLVDGKYKAFPNTNDFAIEIYGYSKLTEIAKKYKMNCLNLPKSDD